MLVITKNYFSGRFRNMLYGNLPLDSLHSWAALNSIELQAAIVSLNVLDADGNSKGGGLVAKHTVSAGDVLLKVPYDLVVSRQQVEQCAKVDPTLRDVLAAVEGFAKVGEAIFGDARGRSLHLEY